MIVHRAPPYNGVRTTTGAVNTSLAAQLTTSGVDDVTSEPYEVCDNTRTELRRSDFDTGNKSPQEMIALLVAMFEDFQLHSTFNIELGVLRTWLKEVYNNYNCVPFHNFRHCFVVTQMVFAVTNELGLRERLDKIDLLTLLVSAICHDLDHPGLNNTYQVNARTELAMRYNDMSPLENHHSATAFDIFDRASRRSDILRNLTPDEYKRFRSQVIGCILGTDMAKHEMILNNYTSIINKFDFKNSMNKSVLLSILVKFADISNESRPQSVAAPWAESLYAEFFAQSDLERKQGLPVAPFMDKDKVVRSQEQCAFMTTYLRPLLSAIDRHMPGKLDDLIKRVDDAITYFEIEAIKDLTTTDAVKPY